MKTMDDEDEEFSTTLAYTKSPKTAKRTSFQDELKRAINARVSRQQAIEDHENSEYSEEFDSDDDSIDDSFKEENPTESKIQKAPYNFDFSDEEEDKPRKISFLKSKTQLEKVEKELDNKRILKNKDSADGLLKSLLSEDGHKDKERTDEKEIKPTPKPREPRIKSNISQNTEMTATIEPNRPIPQKRNLLRKSSHTDFRLSGQDDEKDKKNASFSAPSSFIRLNETLSAKELQMFSEGDNPEGYKLSKSPSPDLLYKSLPRSDGERSFFTEESQIEVKALPVGGNASLHNHNSGRKSPSVLDMMLASVNEKSLQEENNNHLQYTNEVDLKNEPMLHSKEILPEHKHQQTKSKINESKKEEHLEKVRCPSSRSLNSLQTLMNSTKFNASKSPKSANSRYLGTLTVLDKSVKEGGGDIEAADALRATVYQNWLQKKKTFLHELHKMKKSEVEVEREKHQKEIAKKEEAKAAFEAWKSEKSQDIRKHVMKLKEEEEKKLKEIQDIAQKKRESKQAFEKWKEHKDVRLKEKSLTEKQTDKEKKNKEQKEISEKKKNNIAAVNSWNDQKMHVLKEKRKEKKFEKLKEEQKQSEKLEQEKKALEMYEEWLERKERRERIENKHRRLRILLEEDPPPPWSPPGKTIPSSR
ncbi:hypothetical protein XENTR_v10000688 [Xenopus tropicalis]|uniref:Microtubule-associated protein 9 isoform X2 n=1 Tax=Xenopus tropicalis TaxID=8364 RepID=A0A8J0SCT2_XENTR|nr:microtubule-associated protein 9 isoform X2 [Xenopus tropicalis]KAE8630092.1 hypothetical protein XENTR_v10000688 [Xenopus tropicalis]|eukprot:XP_012811085.1 PREDICTED: microtubule-associated protein 9 isoform X2 [Xenopus tropicalis]